MNDPRTISVQDFSYDLPLNRIAAYPLEKREDSKLLIYKNGIIREDIFGNIAEHLPPDSVLFFNTTRVIEARILFQKPTGGQVEIFCLEPDKQYPDIGDALSQKEKVRWHCLVGGASKWKKGNDLETSIPGIDNSKFRAKYIEQKEGSFSIEFYWEPAGLKFEDVLHRTGSIPLPPYIKRKPDQNDINRYQTVYAENPGSVAAPTAGLHFTEKIFRSLQEKNIPHYPLTLHVSSGTFQPVKSETMLGHLMHAEWIEVGIQTIDALGAHLNKKILAVGTTSLRTIESLYWLGLKTFHAPDAGADKIHLGQWEAYQSEKQIPPAEALNALRVWMEKNKMDKLVTKTRILIAPGYPFKIVDGLVTNFHQPHSTLLLLVAALAGSNWKRIYDYALENNFRFLSYGDGSLIWRYTVC